MGRVVALLGIVCLLLAGSLGYWAGANRSFAPGRTYAAEDCVTFEQTGNKVCGRFLEYWQQNGGLAQQGLPLTDAADERSDVDGKVYLTQYFERAVFELHPENQRPYDVLLSLLGREKLLARQQPGAALPRVGQRAAGAGFAVTLHEVRDNVPAEQYSKPKDGFRWVAVDVTVENTGSAPIDYNPFFANLKTGDDREYDPTTGPSSLSPRLTYGKHQPGEKSRGWIVFEVAVGAPLATFSYDPTFGASKVVFDIKP